MNINTDKPINNQDQKMVPCCRFCQAESNQQIVKGEHVFGGRSDQHFWLCKKCQMIYLYPPLTEEEEFHFYKEEFERYMAQRSGSDMDWTGPEKHFQVNQREVQRRLPFLKPYLIEGQRVLEIGCSSGFMLSALKDFGLVPFGLDPSGGFIEYVRAKGIPVFQDIEELKKQIKEPFDLIIHYYVLEHIRNPVAFFQQYMNCLTDNGCMIFEVPCASDPLVELFRVPAFDRFYWSVAHHWYFNQQSLTRVLEKAHFPFELFPEQRYDMSNHMVWMAEGKPGGLGRYSSIFGEQLNALYKTQLKKKWLCDTIIGMVKNKKK